MGVMAITPSTGAVLTAGATAVIDTIILTNPVVYIRTDATAGCMARKADHQIRVSESTWHQLHRRKGPGDSFNDVLERLLDEVEDEESSGGGALGRV
jgi:hypothetical protein